MPVCEINNDHLAHFNTDYIIRKKLSASYQNQIVNGLKLFYSRFHKIEFDIKNIERPKRVRKLPKVIDKGVIEKMLAGIPHIKHKTALALTYGCGLRRSELLQLRPNDLDFDRITMTIRNGKGHKDRVLPLPEKLKRFVLTYIEPAKPRYFLFEGQEAGTPSRNYGTSLTKIFHLYLGKILKDHNFSLHCLRHSYATHLLEAGTDIRYIQELWGIRAVKLQKFIPG